MALFSYKVRDAVGRSLTGTLEAENVNAVAEFLRERNYFIIDIKDEWNRDIGKVFSYFESRVRTKELALFCRQFATLIKAGIPILNCMHILTDQIKNHRFQIALQGVTERLVGGRSLSESMGAFPKIFPEIFTSMIEIGEKGGALEQVLERLSVQYERENEVYEKIKSGMTYPVVILVIAACAVTFMLVFILPKFVAMLGKSGLELPFPTRIVMTVSDVMRKFWPVIAGCIIAIMVGIKKASYLPKVRIKIDSILLKTPVVGNILQKTIVSRFVRSLGTLLNFGVPLVEALETVEKTVGNSKMTRGVVSARKNMINGKGIAGPLASAGVLPEMAVRMIEVGEQSGSLEIMLEKIGDLYDREVDHTLSRLSTLVEPVMVVIIGIILGFIIIAMMMPMFTLMTSLPE